jgi:UDP-N-acetylglucosamine 2-epimerase
MKIVSIVGARPQFIKASTVSRVISKYPGIREIILHTGQHYDENMSRVFFEELTIPEPNYNLGVGSGSHAVQTGRMLKGIEELLVKETPDWTLLYGDTNSTLAGALAATKLHIPVAHVEAGLRSFNRIMPEEINRIVTDRISDLLFAPTETAINNLKREGLAGTSRFTGDVMLDSMLFFRAFVLANPERYRMEELPEKYFLATVHRAENTDHPDRMRDLMTAFAGLPFQVLLPIHPRTRKILATSSVPNNVQLLDPVSYLRMIHLTMNAVKVLTDSGGLQKEAYFLGVPCITLRTETEWLETLHDGWNIVTGVDPVKILRAADVPIPATPRQDSFGDGNAAEKIVEFLQRP